MDNENIEKQLTNNAEEHRQIQEAIKDLHQRHLDLEDTMQPLIDVAPYMADLAGTGRVGMLFGKLLVWLAGILAAIAGIWWTVAHGLGK